jgi:hypothetical protein
VDLEAALAAKIIKNAAKYPANRPSTNDSEPRH